jgi:hypothetical protein
VSDVVKSFLFGFVVGGIILSMIDSQDRREAVSHGEIVIDGSVYELVLKGPVE